MPKNKPRTERLSARTVELGPTGEPPKAFRLLAAGSIPTKKGTIHFDEVAAALVLARAKTQTTDYVIDYAHGSLDPWALDPSLSGKAAGWIPHDALDVRNGELWATRVSWTPPAEAALRNREFRYVSPTVELDENDRVTSFINVALTNVPATNHLDPLVLSGKDQTMKPFAIALSLGENATDVDVINAISTLRTQHAELVALSGKPTHAEALGIFEAHKLAAGQVATLSAKVTELEKSNTDREIASVVDEAITAGKLTPAQREFALTLGAKDLSSLKSFVGAAPVLSAVAGAVKVPASAPATLSDEDRAVAKQLGLKPESLASVAV